MNIYVGNLARTVTEQMLKDLFERYGVVTTVKIIKDRFTGEPRGFAFVEMPEASAATEAINALNRSPLEGNSLRINEARPPEARPHGERRQGGGFGDRDRGNGGGGRPPRFDRNRF